MVSLLFDDTAPAIAGCLEEGRAPPPDDPAQPRGKKVDTGPYTVAPPKAADLVEQQVMQV